MKEFKTHIKAEWSGAYSICGISVDNFVTDNPTCKKCIKKYNKLNSVSKENWAIIVKTDKPYVASNLKLILIRNYDNKNFPSPWDQIGFDINLVYSWQYITPDIQDVWDYYHGSQHIVNDITKLFVSSTINLYLEHVEIFILKNNKFIKVDKSKSDWRV